MPTEPDPSGEPGPAGLSPATRLGHVRLRVADLERCLAFYQDVIGLRLHRRRDGEASLGAGGEDLLVLEEDRAARRVPGTTGLYHFAILVPTRLHLARALRRLMETRARVDGFADHLVSEAIYLPDPEGNGIEIYRDRPRSQWRHDGGRLRMATEPLDLRDLLAELQGRTEPWQGLPEGTAIGHVHLHVADLQLAETFYCGILGFDLVTRYGPAASFVSAGGYHHHVGFNTWLGVGAPPPPPGAAGLDYFVIRLSDREELERVTDRVRKAGLDLESRDGGLLVRDPSRNGVLLAAGTN